MLEFSMYRKIDLRLEKIEIVWPLAVVSLPGLSRVPKILNAVPLSPQEWTRSLPSSLMCFAKNLCSVSQARLSTLPALREDLWHSENHPWLMIDCRWAEILLGLKPCTKVIKFRKNFPPPLRGSMYASDRVRRSAGVWSVTQLGSLGRFYGDHATAETTRPPKQSKKCYTAFHGESE